MPKLQRLDIVLTNPQIVYWPGQVIEGNLHVELSDDMKMRGIRLKCKGKGHVRWTEGSGDNKRTHSSSEQYINESLLMYGKVLHIYACLVKSEKRLHYFSTKTYAIAHKYVVAPHETDDTVKLTAGQHVFPFRFLLPLMLPGSFEGRSQCYVRYWLKGTIDKPWKFDHESYFTFTVGSSLDLNLEPNAMSSLQDQDSKTVCCCCCESGPITASLRLDRTGYVPGEYITCDAEINDGSGHGTASSKIKFKMYTTYRTHGGSTKHEKTEVARLDHEGMEPNHSDIWSGERIQVPPLPPSHLMGCSLIDIDYYIELAVDVLDTPFDLCVTCPVIIGSIPLRSIVEQYLPYYQAQPITDQPAANGGPLLSNIPPPSYQECVFGKTDMTDDDGGNKHATGNTSFAPSYGFYDWLGDRTQYGMQTLSPSAPPIDG